MLRTRELARSLGLVMKVSDVEYQADKSKAIFYYTADDRVDFRELIKKIADEFRRRGKTVVMGGIHVSALPEEAAKHCDAVVVGEAELLWGRVIKDLQNLQRTPFKT